MRKLTLLLIALCFILPSYGDGDVPPTTPPPTTEKLDPIEDDTNPNAAPQDLRGYSIYCSVRGNQATVYSPNSICGEILALDAVTGAPICNAFTDLGGGYSFPLTTSHLIMLYVTVDNITYYCEI